MVSILRGTRGMKGESENDS